MLENAACAVTLSLVATTGCIRRVETLEPAPCSAAPEPIDGHSAIAWSALSPQAGVVYGRVLLVNGEPPAEAFVRLWPDSSAHRVRADGTFRLAATDSGNRTLDVRAVGFERAIATVEMRRSTGIEAFVVLAPAVINFDECGLVLRPVRHWRIGFP